MADAGNRWDVLSAQDYDDNNGDKKTSWLKIGSAFDSKDGQSIMIKMQAVPVNGEAVLRRPKPYEPENQ